MRARTSARSVGGKNRAILLVEDDPDDAALVLRALSRASIRFPVTVARDGEEALARLFDADGRAAAVLPRLVLLDVMLPRMGGFEVLRRLRAGGRTRLVPVILLTSSSRDDDVLTAYQLGANSFLRKPQDGLEFSQTVARWANYWLFLNEIPPA
jgi:CheY-like chemotaxis protein